MREEQGDHCPGGACDGGVECFGFVLGYQGVFVGRAGCGFVLEGGGVREEDFGEVREAVG